MLTITIEKREFFDEETDSFISLPAVTIDLEHSLVSLSKWEAEWRLPCLSSADKTVEQTLSYIKAMCLTPDVSDDVFLRLTDENIRKVNEYIATNFTATWFNETKETRASEVVTSELIYYWMFTLGIPLECEKWNLSRLFTLIKVYNAKNAPPKKRSSREIAEERRRLNEKRRQELKSRG